MEENGPFDPRPDVGPTYPPYYAPQRPSRSWLPIAVISSAILIAGALVAGAVILSGGDNSAPTATTASDAGEAATEDTATCHAWQSTKPAISAIPGLPAGWSWDTPDIDRYITNMNNSTNVALDLFEADIDTDDPSELVEAAQTFINEKRSVAEKLANHTYTSADGVLSNTAVFTLDRLCNTG